MKGCVSTRSWAKSFRIEAETAQSGRLHLPHAPSFSRASVDVAQEMQSAVHGEQGQFLGQGNTPLAGLPPRPGHGDDDVSKVTRAGRRRREGRRKGQDVGHVVLTGEAGVETADPPAVGQHNGHFSGPGARLSQRRFGGVGDSPPGRTGGDFPAKVNLVFHGAGGAGSFDIFATPVGAGAASGVSG